MIEASELCKSYGRIKAVDGVSFTVKRGEVLGFLGPNGAGKSTTMRLLTGYLNPDRGSVHIAGKNLAVDPIAAKQQIGYLPEHAPLYDDMKVDAFLRFIAGMRGYGRRAGRRAADRVIDLCRLKPVRRQTIRTLSKGYTRRTCFAQALLHDPEILIMDEPTDGLDPNQKHDMRQLIREMGREKAIIISTHILAEIDAACTRALVIDRGQQVFDGLPSALRARDPQSGALRLTIDGVDSTVLTERLCEFAFVQRVDCLERVESRVTVHIVPDPKLDNPAVALGDACRREGWLIAQLRPEPGDLEHVFRQLTQTETGE